MHKKACQFNVILREHNEKARKAPPPTPAKGRCTGCNEKFSEDYYCDDECEECGYQACESCAVDESNGECHHVITEYSGPSDTPEVILTHKYQVLLANDAANMYYADKVTSETSAGFKCPD